MSDFSMPRLIARLPKSEKPWNAMASGGYLYMVNEEHQPIRVKEERLEQFDGKTWKLYKQ